MVEPDVPPAVLPPAVVPDVDMLPPDVLPPAVLPVMPPDVPLPAVLPLPDMPSPVVPAVLLPVVPPAVVPLLEPMLPLELVPLLASMLVSPGMVLDESVGTPESALVSVVAAELPALASSALFWLPQLLSRAVLSARVTSGAIILLVNMEVRCWFD